MKPEMSTAVMIERLRALASESQDSVLLSSVASRIELLLAAESGMSREMACIRHALDIPPDQSVQSGVVNECVRLNAKIQDLSGQLSKPEPVYQYQSEIYNEDSGETELYWDDCDIGFYRQYAEDRRRILYSTPVPQAVCQPDAMLCDFYEVRNYPDLVRELVLHIEQLQESARRDVKPWQDTFPETLLPAYIERIKNADAAVRAESQPYTVPDEIEERLFSMRQQAILDGSYTEVGEWENLVCDALKARDACRAAMLQSAPVNPMWVGIDCAEGYALVPIDPTPEMIDSAIGCGVTRGMSGCLEVSYSDVYKAMIAAAPQLDRKDGDA
ncbi:hypothetical protein ABRQ03_08560 [Pectobacterium jejuense]|uniref:hypothetical protein n=1 Tax=Pectobacterium jejuense TaxID=2974022 RepID=UPI0032EB15B3